MNQNITARLLAGSAASRVAYPIALASLTALPAADQVSVALESGHEIGRNWRGIFEKAHELVGHECICAQLRCGFCLRQKGSHLREEFRDIGVCHWSAATLRAASQSVLSTKISFRPSAKIDR